MNKQKRVEEKQEHISEWKEKGIDWCVEKLWKVRREAIELRKELRKSQYEHLKSDIRPFEEENEAMVKVLKKNGIKPDRLTVTYVLLREEEDKDEDYYFYHDYDYDNEPEEFDRYVETISFYSYQITNNRLSGITNCFEELGFDVLKVVNANTGDVLFEKEAADESQHE